MLPLLPAPPGTRRRWRTAHRSAGSHRRRRPGRCRKLRKPLRASRTPEGTEGTARTLFSAHPDAQPPALLPQRRPSVRDVPPRKHSPRDLTRAHAHARVVCTEAASGQRAVHARTCHAVARGQDDGGPLSGTELRQALAAWQAPNKRKCLTGLKSSLSFAPVPVARGCWLAAHAALQI